MSQEKSPPDQRCQTRADRRLAQAVSCRPPTAQQPYSMLFSTVSSVDNKRRQRGKKWGFSPVVLQLWELLLRVVWIFGVSLCNPKNPVHGFFCAWADHLLSTERVDRAPRWDEEGMQRVPNASLGKQWALLLLCLLQSKMSLMCLFLSEVKNAAVPKN